MRECNTFVKSSYLIKNYRSFNMIREIVLEKSISLFQDDTGIPFKYMKDRDLSVQCFGKYVKQLKILNIIMIYCFKRIWKTLYKKGSTKLPFFSRISTGR